MSNIVQRIESEAKKVDDEVHRIIKQDNATGATSPYFQEAKVDIRQELPGLLARLGVDTSDQHNALHAVLTLIVELLARYGPEAIQDVLVG